MGKYHVVFQPMVIPKDLLTCGHSPKNTRDLSLPVSLGSLKERSAEPGSNQNLAGENLGTPFSTSGISPGST